MELVSALVAGRWAAAGRPFAPWLAGYRARLALAAARCAAQLGARASQAQREWPGQAGPLPEGACQMRGAASFSGHLTGSTPDCLPLPPPPNLPPRCVAPPASPPHPCSAYAVHRFPAGASALGDAPAAFAGVAALGVATSFTSTLMFTALGSFFNRQAGWRE